MSIPIWNNQEGAIKILLMQKGIYSPHHRQLVAMLRDLREKAGLTQSILAEKLGRSQSFVSKYEAGELRLDLLEIRSVCETLGTSLSAFVTEFERRTG